MANPEHLKLLKEGIASAKETPFNLSLINFDLSDEDLSNLDLRGADFSNANLSNANLSNSNLKKANLKKAILEETNLEEANLEGANLEEAILIQANFRRANLQSANLIKCKIQGANLSNANIREANLSYSLLVQANLEKADLQFANLEQVALNDTNLQRSVLANANLRKAILHSAKLQKTNLSEADLTDSKMQKAELQGAYLERVILDGANLEGTILNSVNLRESSFQRAWLYNTDFSQANISYCNFLNAKADATTSFKSLENSKGCKVDRYTMEYMSVYLTKGQLMDLDVYDDLEKLQSRFSGIWAWSHFIALAIFFFPYAYFICDQWTRTVIETTVLDSQKTITLLEAIARYIWNGGEGWRQGWNLNFLSFATFCGYITYNGCRLILLIKTKKLETQQAISGLPVKFSLIGFWYYLFNFTTVWFPWLAAIMLCYNTYHFLMKPIAI